MADYKYLYPNFSPLLAVVTFCISTILSHATLDLDGNGYGDVWERKYNAANLDPFQDQDGDGKINLAEHHDGTDPFDEQSVCAGANSRKLFFNQMVVSWPTILGVNYDLETSATLQASEWGGSGVSLIGTGGSILVRVQSGSERSFFRVGVPIVDSQLSANFASQISSDTDGDGDSDWNEWITQTNIFDPGSFMEAPSIRELSGVGIHWDSQLGKEYQLESRILGSGQAWADLGQARSGTGDAMEAVLPFEGDEARVYSIRVQDVDSDGDGLNDWEEGILGLRPDLTHTDHLGEGDYNEAVELLSAVNRVNFSTPIAIGNVTRSLDGSFEIRRESGLNRLEIELLVSGDATPGGDYIPLPEVIVFPFGKKSITIPVELLPEASVSLVETVTVRLGDSPLYEVEGNATQTINLLSENQINVRDYGAVGDGVTDDRLAIQDAINALEASSDNNTLYFPDGQYNLASYVTDSLTHTSTSRILRLGATELAGRDLILSFDENASLYSTVSPVRAHILECEAKFRSLTFYGAQLEKNDVVLDRARNLEPNGADGISLVMHDLREVKMVQFLDCRFFNCHGAISTYGAGFDTRGLLQYFRVQDCHILNPWGANSVTYANAFGGGQLVNILPWVGTAEYTGNYFDGGSEARSDLARNPLGREKDGSHFGSPLRLLFRRNIVEYMRVEAVFMGHDPFMGLTDEDFEFPVIGEEITVKLVGHPSTYTAGDKLAIRGTVPELGVRSVSVTVVDYQNSELELTVRNDGENDFLLDTVSFTGRHAVYLQGEEHVGEALIIDNVVRASTTADRRFFSGIVATAKATIRRNYVEGYTSGILIYGNINTRTPLSPPSKGTLIEDNVIYTSKGISSRWTTYGIQSFGFNDMIRKNLMITPVSTRVVGIALRGRNTIARDNTIIAESIVRHDYSTFDRSVGIGVGNASSLVRIEGNTTRGFDVGVGPANPFQSIPHYASGNLSFEDFLIQDVRGLIEE